MLQQRLMPMAIALALRIGEEASKCSLIASKHRIYLQIPSRFFPEAGRLYLRGRHIVNFYMGVLLFIFMFCPSQTSIEYCIFAFL